MNYDLKINDTLQAISARAARSVEAYHQSGVVPSLRPIVSPKSTRSPSIPRMDINFSHDDKKRKRRPAPLPHISSASTSSHPTAVVRAILFIAHPEMCFINFFKLLLRLGVWMSF
jgi:hypothetical protein